MEIQYVPSIFYDFELTFSWESTQYVSYMFLFTFYRRRICGPMSLCPIVGETIVHNTRTSSEGTINMVTDNAVLFPTED